LKRFKILRDDDGFVATVPIRYGLNILEWNWDERVSSNNYCYRSAAPVAVGTGQPLPLPFAFERINPRIGKVVREVRLKSTHGFQRGSQDFNNELGPVINSNAVMQMALKIVKKRG
jgi:hypothetical protein